MAKRKTKAEIAGAAAADGIAKIKSDAAGVEPSQAAGDVLGPVETGKQRVRFIKNYTVDDERRGSADEESYVEGEIVDLAEASARHFMSRGVARQIAD